MDVQPLVNALLGLYSALYFDPERPKNTSFDDRVLEGTFAELATMGPDLTSAVRAALASAVHPSTPDYLAQAVDEILRNLPAPPTDTS